MYIICNRFSTNTSQHSICAIYHLLKISTLLLSLELFISIL